MDTVDHPDDALTENNDIECAVSFYMSFVKPFANASYEELDAAVNILISKENETDEKVDIFVSKYSTLKEADDTVLRLYIEIKDRRLYNLQDKLECYLCETYGSEGLEVFERYYNESITNHLKVGEFLNDHHRG